MKKIKVFLGILLAVAFFMPVCNAFTDMDSNHWAYKTVNLMTEKGILSGFTDGSFRPDNYISREQFATILSKTVEYANIELPINTENSWNFKDCIDVDNSRWSYEYIQKAFNVMGKSEGKNNGCYFEPDALMSREEVAKIMVNAKGLGKEEPDYSLLNKFSDKQAIGSNYEKYVAIAVKNGIMSGNANGTFEPKKNLTRAQIASLMSKLLDDGKNFKADAISEKYVKIYNFSDGLAKVQNNNGKWGYINAEFREVIPCVYDEVKYFSEGVARVKRNEKWGYINKDGKEIVPCIYDDDDLGDYSEGLIGLKQGTKWGFINEKGQNIALFIYDDADKFSEGMAKVENNEKYGYINAEGQEIIPCIYDNAYNFSEGMAMIKKGDKWGYINTEGKEIIPCEYDSVISYLEGMIMIKNLDMDYIDTEIKEGSMYDYIYSFSEGMAMVRKGEKCGYINTEGKEIIPCVYDNVHNFSEGIAKVKKGEKWGCINIEGKEIIPCVYEDYNIGDCLGGLIAVKKEGKWGQLDKMGKEVIPCMYDSMDIFSEGLARVEKDRKWGYINTKGEEVIPLIYYMVGNFSNGIALAINSENKAGLIDKMGKEVIPCVYDCALDENTDEVYLYLKRSW